MESAILHLPLYTALSAACLILIQVALMFSVIKTRGELNVFIGHGDSEALERKIRAHGNSKIVASLSLGGPRRFCLRPRRQENATTASSTSSMISDIDLPPGSILLMKGNVQENFEHSLPLYGDESTTTTTTTNTTTTTTKKKNPLRISLTFRSIVPGFEQGRETATDICCI